MSPALRGPVVVQHRKCRYCGEVYELTKDNFGHNPQGGFRWKCRRCVREYVRQYNAANWLRAEERTEIRRGTTFTQSERWHYGPRIAARDGGFFASTAKSRWAATITLTTKFRSLKVARTASTTSCSRACPATRKSTQKTLTNIESGDEPDAFPFCSNRRGSNHDLRPRPKPSGHPTNGEGAAKR
jgi:hypothetical protein